MSSELQTQDSMVLSCKLRTAELQTQDSRLQTQDSMVANS